MTMAKRRPAPPPVKDDHGHPTTNSALYLKRAEDALAEVDLSSLSNAELIAYAQATASIAAAGSLLRIDDSFPDVYAAAHSVLRHLG